MRGSGISQKKFCPCFNNIQNVHGHSPLKSPASFRWAEMKQRKEVCGWHVLEQPVLPGENCKCNPDTKDCSRLSGLASLTPCWRKGGVKHARRGKRDLVSGLNADRGLSGRNHTGRRGWDRAAAAGEGQAFPQIPIIILPGLAGHIPRFPILSHQGIQALWKFSGPGQIFPRAQTPGRTRPSTTVSRITFKIRRGGNKKKKKNKCKLHMELQSAAGAASGCSAGRRFTMDTPSEVQPSFDHLCRKGQSCMHRETGEMT